MGKLIGKASALFSFLLLKAASGEATLVITHPGHSHPRLDLCVHLLVKPSLQKASSVLDLLERRRNVFKRNLNKTSCTHGSHLGSRDSSCGFGAVSVGNVCVCVPARCSWLSIESSLVEWKPVFPGALEPVCETKPWPSASFSWSPSPS